MALVVADRVQETTTTTGTGTYTLAGAKAGFQSFAAVGDGNTTYYACTDGTDYEVGIGTYTATGTTLARTTIIESSNSDAAVNWGAGEKDIFVTLPASKATVLDASGDFTLVGDAYNVTWDKSTDDLKFPAGAAAEFGDNGDLRIFVGGDGHSYISESQSGNLRIMGADIRIQSPIGEDIISGVNNGAVSLMYNGSTKVATTNTGASITGNITVTGTVDGVDIATNIPASLGTAGQVLTVNAGATAGEWADAAGGGADLYAANESSPAAQPSATGTNAIAIGDSAISSGIRSVAFGKGNAAGSDSFAAAIGNASTSLGARAANSVAIGPSADCNRSNSIALGYQATVAGGGGTGTVAISQSYASGADSFAAVKTNNTSSYGATGANSIAMGKQNKADSTEAVSIGGNMNSATSSYASVMGGTFNTNQGTRAIIAGGQSNTIATAGQYGVIVGGNNNSVTGDRGVIVGGANNEANASHTFATGEYAKAAEIGKLARATGRFSADGDAQGGQFILRADTTDATATVLTTNNSTAASTNQIVAASDTCITFDGTITAMQNGAQAYASWKIEGLLVNDGGTTTLANSATTVISNSSSWGMALSADTGNNALAITVTGEASHNIRWVANIRTTEVTYA